MKKAKIMMMALVATLSIAAVSCGKDYAKDVEGSYAGTLDMAVSGATMGSFDATVVVKADGDDAVSLTLPTIGEGRTAIPELTLSGVNVDKDGSNYTLKKDNFTITVDNIAYTGSIDGTVKDSKLNFACDITPGAMPMAINLTFSSK